MQSFLRSENTNVNRLLALKESVENILVFSELMGHHNGKVFTGEGEVIKHFIK